MHDADISLQDLTYRKREYAAKNAKWWLGRAYSACFWCHS